MMINILLNEIDPERQKSLLSSLELRGYQVWPAQNLNEIVSTLEDVSIDLIILDLDSLNLDQVVVFADRLSGIVIVFNASSNAPTEDFRCWIADEFIVKGEKGENISTTVAKYFPAGSQNSGNNNLLRRAH